MLKSVLGITPLCMSAFPDTPELGRSSSVRRSGVGRSFVLNLDKVFQSAMKILVAFSGTFGRSSNSTQKFWFSSVAELLPSSTVKAITVVLERGLFR